MPATKEVIADAASGSAWVNKTPRQVRRSEVDGSTPGYIGHAVSVEHALSPFLILIFGPLPPYGLNMILQVANKWQSTSPALVGNIQKLDVVIYGKLHGDLDCASIFSKVIGHKLSNGSRNDLYLRCRMNFVDDVIQTQIPQFMDLGIPTINKLDESSVLGAPATRILRPTDGSH